MRTIEDSRCDVSLHTSILEEEWAGSELHQAYHAVSLVYMGLKAHVGNVGAYSSRVSGHVLLQLYRDCEGIILVSLRVLDCWLQRRIGTLPCCRTFCETRKSQGLLIRRDP